MDCMPLDTGCLDRAMVDSYYERVVEVKDLPAAGWETFDGKWASVVKVDDELVFVIVPMEDE